MQIMPGVTTGTRQPNGRVDWAPPNQGRMLVSHNSTFMSTYSSLAACYRPSDEAVLDSRYNAFAMTNDVGIRECLDSRQRSVALLNWKIEPEDEKSPSQVEFCGMIEKVIKRISHFYEYRLNCQDAIWYGRVGMQHRWGVQIVDGKSVYMPTPKHQDDYGWEQVHGDKLVFRQNRPGYEMPPGGYEGQLGIRVGINYTAGDAIGFGTNQWQVQPTDFGLAYFLTPAQRRLMLVHKHHVKDAAYEDGLRAGSIYGVGIRSVIYWEWVQKQETMAFLMEYLERMAGGIQIWKYPTGNAQAEAAAKQAAENYNSGQQHIVLMPVPPGEVGDYGVDIIDPGFGGIDVLQKLIHEYFGHRIKRYILGQILSSESDATGLGSGVAELHMDTLLQILKSDAINLEETLTSDLVSTIIKVNVARKVWMDPGFTPKFSLITEDADASKILENCSALIDRGLKVRTKDLYELVGIAAPGPDDEVLEPPSGTSPPAFNPNGDFTKPPEERASDHGGETEPSQNGSTNGVVRYGKNRFKRTTLVNGYRFSKPNGKK